MYGLWHNELNKWMIDKFNHETQEEENGQRRQHHKVLGAGLRAAEADA